MNALTNQPKSLAQALPSLREVEVIVVGLGAGGSVVFHDLVERGYDVIALEYGSLIP